MVQFPRSFSAAVSVSSLVLFHLLSFASADPIVELRLDERDDGPPEASFYGMKQGGDEFGAIPLNGRDLVRSWLGKRACVDAGYYACTSSYGCCPNGSSCCSLGCCRSPKSCCPNSLYCADPGDKCCGSRGTCESGWNCCGTIGCYPDGGQCCSNGRYCSAGNKCYIVNGRNACCTDSKCTAHVSNGITSTRGGGGFDDSRTSAGGGAGVTSSPSAADVPTTTSSETITTPTLPSSDPTATIPEISINYYFTYSWYYVSWYWYYYTFVASTSSTTTSTTVTTSTIFTISEADSASARSSYREMTSTFPTAAPAEASAILTGGAGASSTVVTGTRNGGNNFTGTGIQVPSGVDGPVTVTGGAVSTGSASSGSQSKGVRRSEVEWSMMGFVVLGFGSGLAMIWL